MCGRFARFVWWKFEFEYLIPLQYGIFHISLLQSQARSHNAEDVVMSSI